MTLEQAGEHERLIRYEDIGAEFSSRQQSVAVTDDADVLSEITTDQLKTGPLILIEQASNKLKSTARKSSARPRHRPGQLHRHSLDHRRSTGLATSRDTPLAAVSSAEILAPPLAAMAYVAKPISSSMPSAMNIITAPGSSMTRHNWNHSSAS